MHDGSGDHKVCRTREGAGSSGLREKLGSFWQIIDRGLNEFSDFFSKLINDDKSSSRLSPGAIVHEASRISVSLVLIGDSATFINQAGLLRVPQSVSSAAILALLDNATYFLITASDQWQRIKADFIMRQLSTGRYMLICTEFSGDPRLSEIHSFAALQEQLARCLPEEVQVLDRIRIAGEPSQFKEFVSLYG